MAGLEGTVKTPFGAVQKKTALILGGGVVILGGIVWYRQKQQAKTATPNSDQTGEIDPATGFPYGSAEDAAALAAQTSYQSASSSSSSSSTSTSFTTNAQWSQAAIEYMLSNGLVADSTALSTALGKFLTGAYVTDSQVSLIEQAIAVEGKPPVAGTNGYPPSLNRSTSSSSSDSNVTHVISLHVTSATSNSLTFGWSYLKHTPDFQLVYLNNVPKANIDGAARTMTFHDLKPKTSYIFQVRGVLHSVLGPTSTITGKTK